ncbi:D-alanyl-D-alanine carboxypeptidase/D-alanyl-D-alanine-endopeptidase [Nocardioides sp. AE5]|uniref:D-alanyl-D-alanine carboxypeptidase/D-alanyl-D-alanine endopeptidase n=1 Tax=Nocardioides sp. AE5 TaxID=2962573 RepID=UPI002882ABE9|nr:D-alanyl-D-alanine carboxypeptidase/D-alanyl-D-alanine-endopeptidase [Nocardioides sp. AE5]MDT0200590.1 D-alanyl-D-alanine carboxypeptidase/D-alanyl-D-alanine-endopeptidase [Nocardioides sp. AE5]
MPTRRRAARDAGRPSRLAAWGPVVLVLAVIASAFAAFEYDVAERLGWAAAEADPAEIAPPEGLELPQLTTPEPVAQGVDLDSGISDERVAAALAPYADLPELGERRMLVVAGMDGVVHFQQGVASTVPASTMKIVTGAAAIESLGAETTFTTAVRAGAAPDEIVLVGGGDPYLMRVADPDAYPAQADLATLATQTALALQGAGTTEVRLGFDDSLFSGPRVSPDWPANYIPDAVVSPISPLYANQGRKEDGWGFEADPALGAARIFADELAKRGITVTGSPRRTIAPARVAPAAPTPTPTPTQASADPSVPPAPADLVPGQELAAVQSAPVWQIVDRVLAVSDNEGAEILAHHVAIAEGADPTFAGASIAVRAVLKRLGVNTSDDRILDGSGLSRKNLLTATTLLEVMALAGSAEHPELRPVLTGLPIAGFTGSLARRYVDSPEPGLGRVRAKTGTLTGVHGLAGTTTDLDGNVFVFVFLADRVEVPETLDARAALEDLTAALAACHCSA